MQTKMEIFREELKGWLNPRQDAAKAYLPCFCSFLTKCCGLSHYISRKLQNYTGLFF